MARKASLLLIFFALLLGLLSPGLVGAQSGLSVTESSATVQFPARLQFNISARSDSTIIDIRLRYRVVRTTFTEVTSEAFVIFTPAEDVKASWVLNMVRFGGLPPGSILDYWWLVRDAAGKKAETVPSRVQFDDLRYSWQTLSAPGLTLRWYEGNQGFAQNLMSAAQQALARLAADTGARPERPITMYIYANSQDLQGAMIAPQEWVGGGAFTGFGILALGIAPAQLDWGKGALAHELTHLVIHEMTDNPYSGLPTWLDEGLAMHSEGPITASNLNMIKSAAANNALISVRSLSSPFSAYPELAYLSYAESQSIVEFMLTSYGQARMLDLLKTFREGATYDGALQKIYGFNMDGLNSRWQEYVRAQFQIKPKTVVFAPVAVPAGV